MLKGILPKEYAFFDYFDQLIFADKQISILFLLMLNNKNDRQEISRQIKDLEKHTEKLSRNCSDLLHNTFITPLDRNDIFILIHRLDDFANLINSATYRVSIYDISEVRPEAIELTKIIQACVDELTIAIRELRKMRNKNMILECCKKVHDYENQADEILRNAISVLFKEGELLLLFKWKEIFERLEKTVDKCEDIAITIESILIEHS